MKAVKAEINGYETLYHFSSEHNEWLADQLKAMLESVKKPFQVWLTSNKDAAVNVAQAADIDQFIADQLAKAIE